MSVKRIVIHSEIVYGMAILMLSFAVAMMTAADFGVSMIVAPAYILSRKFAFLTFGQCEAILQSFVFVIFCILMKGIKLVYFSSFLTCLFYGAALDFWRRVIPLFNPAITPPGSMAPVLRVLFLAAGMVLTALSVAFFFRTYLYPQVYDFFVKGISAHFHKDRTKFKIIFDMSCLLAAVIMTLIFFGRFVGVGAGTFIMAAGNGLLIGRLGQLLDKYILICPYAKKLAVRFEF